MYIKVDVDVRYWGDTAINGKFDYDGVLIPFKCRYSWCPVIRLADGRVMDWPAGMAANVLCKVCEVGDFWLLDKDKEKIGKWNGLYVPNFLCPDDYGYGHHIVLTIHSSGLIHDWIEPSIEFLSDGNEDDQSKWKFLLPQENS